MLEDPKIPVAAVLVWGAPNILLVGCAADAPKENPVPTGLGWPKVLEFDEPNSPPVPVFPPREEVCCPNRPPVGADVAAWVPKSVEPPALKPVDIFGKNKTSLKSPQQLLWDENQHLT